MRRVLLVFGLCAVLTPFAASQYFDAQALAEAKPEAKVHLQKAIAARAANDFAKMFEEYKLALQIQPDALEIHHAFIVDMQMAVVPLENQVSMAKEQQLKKAASDTDSKSGKSTSELTALKAQLKQRRELLGRIRALREDWMKQYPDKAIYPYLVAKSMEWADCEKQEPLLQKAIALDPKFVPALEYMADLKGWLQEKDAAAEYMKKVVDLKPGDDEVRIRYAAKLREVDPGAGDKLLQEILAHNPANAIGLQAATSLISTIDEPAGKVAAAEHALRQFPPEKFKEMRFAIFPWLEAYAAVDPARGLELARALQSQAAKQNDRYFQPRLDYLNAIVQSKAFTGAGQYAEAYAVLEKVETPEGMKPKALVMMKADAARGAGKPATAYEVLSKYFAASPEDEAGDALAKCASALGKSKDDVDKEVWAIREARAYTLKDAPLKRMENDQQIRLSDFKGKVVLLSFWHPG